MAKESNTPKDSMESLFAEMMANSNMTTDKEPPSKETSEDKSAKTKQDNEKPSDSIDKTVSGSAKSEVTTEKNSDNETDKKAIAESKPKQESTKEEPTAVAEEQPSTTEVLEETSAVEVEPEPEQEVAKEEPTSVQEEQPANPEVPEQTPVVEAEPKTDEPAEAESAVVEESSTTEGSSEAEPEQEDKKEAKTKKRKSKGIKLTTERAVVTVVEDGDKKSGKFFDKDGITISNDELLSVRNTKSLYTNSDGWDKMQFLKSRMGLESANQLMDFILRYDKTRGLDKWAMSWEEERELMHKQSEQRKMPANERKRITFRVSKEADEHLNSVMELIPAIKMSTIVNKMFNDFFDEYNNLLKNR